MNVAVFIDGSNFYSKLKELGIQHTSMFDYYSFIKLLSKSETITFIGYYAGQIRKENKNPKSEELYARQQKFLAYLKSNIPDLQVTLGHIQNYNGSYKEKGVDVRIALDIYKFANQNKYDKAILISSDSDLLPAVRMAQELGKIIEYVGFAIKPSIALIKGCKSRRLLNHDDLLPFEYNSK